ncbi:MAG: DoxX family membrane protein [Elusimicrobia bacterium]|nr:DoxX family membrane protein [Elusimicrobiota bacterium]
MKLPHPGAVCRFALGAVFLYAGFMKAAAPAEEFAYAIESYGLFPRWAAMAAAYTLPWAELALGALLLSGALVRQAALCAGALLLIFAGLLGYVLAAGLHLKDCGCFGSGGGSPRAELFLDLGLLLCCYIVRLGGRLPRVPRARL